MLILGNPNTGYFRKVAIWLWPLNKPFEENKVK